MTLRLSSTGADRMRRIEHANLATAGTLTAGATSSTAQVEGAPVASGRAQPDYCLPLRDQHCGCHDLTRGLRARLYQNYTGATKARSRPVGAEHCSKHLCADRLQSGVQWPGTRPAAAWDSGHGSKYSDVAVFLTNISQGHPAASHGDRGWGGSVSCRHPGSPVQYASSAPIVDSSPRNADSPGKMTGVGITGPRVQPGRRAAAASYIGVNVRGLGREEQSRLHRVT